MAAQADITINDGATTPVATLFKARGVRADTALYVEPSSGRDIGNPKITITTKNNPRSPNVVHTLRVTLPTMEVVSGSDGGYTPQPKVAFEHMVKVEFTCPRRGVTQERKHIRAFAANLLAHATTQALVHDQDVPF